MIESRHNVDHDRAMTSTTNNASKSKSPSPSQNEHLSFPALPAEQPSVLPQLSRQVLKDRLYIGNLHPSVDEYVSYYVPTISELGYIFVQILSSPSLLQVRQSHQARFFVSQDRSFERETPWLCIYRIRKQPCTSFIALFQYLAQPGSFVCFI
jgi:hypothetical protein